MPALAASALIPTVETITVNGMVSGPRSPITFDSSPTLVQNTTVSRLLVIVSGGTVSLIEFSRDGSLFESVGLLGGQFVLGLGDMLRISFLLAPLGACYPI